MTIVVDPDDLQSEQLSARTAASVTPEDATVENTLRPSSYDEFVGQQSLVEKIKLFTAAARKRSEPLDHLLLCGPPGLGKTTLAYLIAREMSGNFYETSGPALVRPGDAIAILSSLRTGDVLFIDEIHRLNRVVEETLYPAMEDFKVDIMLDSKGPTARSFRLDLPRFTLIGATTRAGLLTAPLRDRFGFIERLEFYPTEDLAHIIQQSSRKLAVDIDSNAASELASRSRGTPRIANRLLKRVRDFAQVHGDGRVTLAFARKALELLGVDDRGLDRMDRRILQTIIDFFSGGPVGVESLAASLGEDLGTLEDVYEPFLLQAGLLARTPRGRVITRIGAAHVKKDYDRLPVSQFLRVDASLPLPFTDKVESEA
jgi:Holliday junction DNA helicase RuvB